MEIVITCGEKILEATLFDTPTSQAIIESLPIERTVSTWGHEIYFQVDAISALEDNARSEVEIGNLAYWPTMPAFCIFFGATPMSAGKNPVAASPVNIIGKLKKIDLATLRSLTDGEHIRVEKKV